MIGKCELCDLVIIANNESEYEWFATNHILSEHRDEVDIDEIVIRRL